MNKRDLRNQKITRQNEIMSGARQGGRDLTDEETRELEELQREIDQLSAEIRAEEEAQGGDAVQEERTRAAEITSLCREFGMDARDYIANGQSVDQVRAAVIEQMRAQHQPIGARSVENQQHRLTSSGIDIPVGMKNPTSGDISVMLNSITAAQHSHTFIYRGWDVTTSGNPMAHAILRGYVNKHGEAIPNYHYEDLAHLYDQYSAKGLENMALIVDANHSNSDKKYLEQIRIAKEILHSCRYNPDIKKMVKGLMIESYIEDGTQKIGEGIYGKSITDPCIGWEKTERLVLDIADLL